MEMKTEELSRQIVSSIKSDILGIKKDIGELKIELADIKDNSINKEIELIEAYLEGVSTEDITKGAENTFRTITLIGNIDSELDVIDNAISQLSIPSNTIPQHIRAKQKIFPTTVAGLKGFLGKVKSNIKKLSAHLWQFLSQMMNLNKWSVAGNANLNICGFSGGVTLQLIFE